jgi:hypothetical protein
MSLEQIFYVSQTAAALAVVASLLFVGFQIRHGTRATRAQIHQNIASGWFSVGPLIAANRQVFAAGIRADEARFAALPDDDKIALMAMLFVYFKHYENMYLQYREGFVSAEDWNAWSSHMFMYWRMPGVQVWWRLRRLGFAPEFRKFLETSTPPAMISMEDVFATNTSQRNPSGTSSPTTSP